MNDPVSLFEGKLDDPIVLDAALGAYSRGRPLTPAQRSAMEAAWFDAAFLSRQLDAADDRIVEQLLAVLPDHVFAPLAAEIADRWDGWPERLACCSAALLARCVPETARDLFASKLDSGSCVPAIVEAILDALPHLPAAEGTGLLTSVSGVALKDPERAGSWHLNRLFQVALQLDPELARTILPACFERAATPAGIEDLLRCVLFGVFRDLPFGRLAAEIGDDMSEQKLAAIPSLFRDGAPLAELDRNIRGPADPEELIRLLDAWMQPDDRELIALAARKVGERSEPDLRREFNQFLIDALASACAAETLPVGDLGLDDCVELLAVDLPGVPHHDLLVERLRDFPSGRTAEAMIEVFERPSWHASSTLAGVMGSLGLEDFVVPLTECLAEDCGDFLCEAAAESLVRLGPPARDHLIGEWERLDSSQRIYGRSVIQIVGGAPAAEFTLRHLESLLAEDMDFACDSALAVPDQCMIAALTPHLKRGQYPIDRAFYVLARLHGEAPPQLDEVTERLRKRNARAAAPSVFGEPLDLRLKCRGCGTENDYEVKRVVRSDHGDERLLIGEEFPCVSCGRFEDFAITPLALVALLQEYKEALEEGLLNGGQVPESVVQEAFVQYGGRRCPVGEVIHEAREILGRNPQHVAAWTMLGTCYQQVLDRPRHARQFLDRALEIEPQAVKATLWKAAGHELLDENEEAFELLDDALARRTGWVFDDGGQADRTAFTREFARRYNALRERAGRTDRPALQSDFLPVEAKVGRNDPCPCGSGRKYKRCCLRAGR